MELHQKNGQQDCDRIASQIVIDLRQQLLQQGIASPEHQHFMELAEGGSFIYVSIKKTRS